MAWYEKIDLEAYIRSRVAVLNTEGGRGYDIGVRIFDCPMPGCGDSKGRGWFNVQWGAAGCFNAGCMADPKVQGLEWIKELEGIASKGQTVSYLLASFPARGPKLPPTPPKETYQDFCNFPSEMRRFKLDPGSQFQLMFEKFAQQQWGLNLVQLMDAEAGWCVTGYYAWRIIFPVIMGGRPVAFQARTMKGAEAKYLTSRYVGTEKHPAECGRPAEAILYGLDEIRQGEEVVLVEGIGDVLGCKRQNRKGVGLLGTQLTSEKLALLRAKKPGRVVAALDAGEDTSEATQEAVRGLLAWGMDAVPGTWAGGKDAAAGGLLELQVPGIAGQVARKLKG